MNRPRSRHRALPVRLRLLLLAACLAGCEAPLDLSGVEAQLSRTTHRSDLFQAIARDLDAVIAVGGMGTVLRSADGGESWKRTTLPGNPFLLDVVVCPDGGFHALENTDGVWSLRPDGNWARQALPEMTEPQALTCDRDNTLWVAGGFSTILHSTNGGADWDAWSLEEDLYLTTIQFVDERHGIVTGEFGAVLKSDDAGLTWTRADDLPGNFYPQSALFITPETGWVVGLNGTVWKTGDGAQSWQAMTTGVSTPLYGIAGLGDTLVAVGDNTTILYYRDGDSAWAELENATKSRTYLRGVTALGHERFLAAGGGVLFTVTIPAGIPGDAPETPDA